MNVTKRVEIAVHFAEVCERSAQAAAVAANAKAAQPQPPKTPAK